MNVIDSNQDYLGVVDTNIGGRSENQDYTGFAQTDLGLLIVICDGMGGMQGGQIASKVTTESVINYIKSIPPNTVSETDAISAAIANANTVVYNMSAESGIKMGTTIALLLINETAAFVAHVGDSRIYKLRNGKKIFRSFDHSMVFDMVKVGVLTEEQARLSDKSNIITKCVGVYETVEPEISSMPYESKDRFFLCSDGVWNTMNEKALLKYFFNKYTIGAIKEKLVNDANRIGIQKGTQYDNMSLAILETKKDSITKEKMNRKAKLIIICLSILLAISLVFNIAGLFNVQKEQVPDNVTETTQKISDSLVESKPSTGESDDSKEDTNTESDNKADDGNSGNNANPKDEKEPEVQNDK